MSAWHGFRNGLGDKRGDWSGIRGVYVGGLYMISIF